MLEAHIEVVPMLGLVLFLLPIREWFLNHFPDQQLRERSEPWLRRTLVLHVILHQLVERLVIA